MEIAKRVMLIDDSADDAEFVRRAVRHHHPDVELVVHRSGEEGLASLVASAAGGDGRHSDLVLLDLKLPRLDGLEILAEVRRHLPASVLPLVVFTSSREPRDVSRAFAAGASSYVTKPVSFDDYRETVGEVVRYWLYVNVPSPGAGHA